MVGKTKKPLKGEEDGETEKRVHECRLEKRLGIEKLEWTRNDSLKEATWQSVYVSWPSQSAIQQSLVITLVERQDAQQLVTSRKRMQKGQQTFDRTTAGEDRQSAKRTAHI